MSPGPVAPDGDRLIANLRELARRTSDAEGAQRVAWTPTWTKAREFLLDTMSDLPVTNRVDAAGNIWIELEGEEPEALVIGSHLDSVPSGGWLDGALGVFAGAEVLRSFAAGPRRCSIRLVDWADEEGVRFGRSLFGSGAAAGSLEDGVLDRADADGVSLRDALAANNVDPDAIAGARIDPGSFVAYLELHIEQGPVLDTAGESLAAVEGALGVERWLLVFTGQSAHSGATPIALRRDPLVAASRFIAAATDAARERDVFLTFGSLGTHPGVATVIAARVELTLDLRAATTHALAEMLAAVRELAAAEGARAHVEIEWRSMWSIPPVDFDAQLVAHARTSVHEVTGSDRVMRSGPLHDAVEMARLGVETAMVFTASRGGLSHTGAEDTDEADIRLGLDALHRLALRVVEGANRPDTS